MVASNWNFDNKEIQASEGAVVKWDDHQFFSLLYKGQKFYCEILEDLSEDRKLKIKVNQRVFVVQKKGPLDELIAAMGLDKPKIRKIKELVAPMPGRVVSIDVVQGQEIQTGDAILSLEAMKMENVLKAEGIGTVKSILVQPGQVVDKGVVMIEFE